MFFAKIPQFDTFGLYVNLIDEYLDQKNELGVYLEEIFTESKKVLNKSKSYYEVDSNLLPIISYLVSSKPEFIKDADNLDDDTWRSLKKHLQEVNT